MEDDPITEHAQSVEASQRAFKRANIAAFVLQLPERAAQRLPRLRRL